MPAATSDVTPVLVKQIVRCGITFNVTALTPRCIILESTKTHKTATFTSYVALNNFLAQWEWWMGYKKASAA
jgi:hypothetical protein